jgi:hypothetical protein
MSERERHRTSRLTEVHIKTPFFYRVIAVSPCNSLKVKGTEECAFINTQFPQWSYVEGSH